MNESIVLCAVDLGLALGISSVGTGAGLGTFADRWQFGARAGLSRPASVPMGIATKYDGRLMVNLQEEKTD
jgi:hypothetical protein